MSISNDMAMKKIDNIANYNQQFKFIVEKLGKVRMKARPIEEEDDCEPR